MKPQNLTRPDSVRVLANLYTTAKIKLQGRESENRALRDTLSDVREQEADKIKKARSEAKKEGRRFGLVLGSVGIVVIELLALIVF